MDERESRRTSRSGKDHARAQLRRAVTLVQQSGIAERMGLRRPTPLPEFLTQLLETAPAHDATGGTDVRDDLLHLGRQWSATAAQVAHPASLPEVVERRNRVRVNPVAPWSTAAVAAGGAGVVVAGPWPGAVEVIAVAAVAGLSAAATGSIWRPRVARRDRKHTVHGGAALAARANLLVGAHAALDSGTSQALLGRVHGAARAVESVEVAARRAGLLDDLGNLSAEPQVPAHRQVVEELLHQRAELTHLVLRLQHTAQSWESRLRQEDRASYQRLLDDMDEA